MNESPVREQGEDTRQTPELPLEAARSGFRGRMRLFVGDLKQYPVRKADPEFKFKEPLEAGWLLAYLLPLEEAMWGRWDHWQRTNSARQVLAEPIPRIAWDHGTVAQKRARKMLEDCLNATTDHGPWMSWGSFDNFTYFLNWVLFGFGAPGHKTEPKAPALGASERLYQIFDLGLLLLAPNDYLGDILAENAHGRHLGFYPTPHTVTELMVAMTMGDGSGSGATDPRLKSVMDPCVGTGRMLLSASNFSYRLFAMDINPTVILVTLFNGWLYAPWLVSPAGWMDAQSRQYADPARSGECSDTLAAAAAGDLKAASYLGAADSTEHDPVHQPHCEPIKIRRRKVGRTDGRQLSLFTTAGS